MVVGGLLEKERRALQEEAKGERSKVVKERKEGLRNGRSKGRTLKKSKFCIDFGGGFWSLEWKYRGKGPVGRGQAHLLTTATSHFSELPLIPFKHPLTLPKLLYHL